MIGNKIADKITSVLKKRNNNDNYNEDVEMTAHKNIYIYLQRKDRKIINELRLVPKKDVYFLRIIDELMLILKKIIYKIKRKYIC